MFNVTHLCYRRLQCRAFLHQRRAGTELRRQHRDRRHIRVWARRNTVSIRVTKYTLYSSIPVYVSVSVSDLWARISPESLKVTK